MICHMNASMKKITSLFSTSWLKILKKAGLWSNMISSLSFPRLLFTIFSSISFTTFSFNNLVYSVKSPALESTAKNHYYVANVVGEKAIRCRLEDEHRAFAWKEIKLMSKINCYRCILWFNFFYITNEIKQL